MDRQIGTRPSQVKDARGRVVTLLDPYALHLLYRYDTIPQEVLGELAAEIGSGWPRRKRLRRVCRTMLKHLRCPHCGYDLRLLPVDGADGATVCPECGGAWRLAAGRPAS